MTFLRREIIQIKKDTLYFKYNYELKYLLMVVEAIL